MTLTDILCLLFNVPANYRQTLRRKKEEPCPENPAT